MGILDPDNFDLNKLIEAEKSDNDFSKQTLIDLYCDGLLTDEEFDALTLQ